MTEWKMMFKPSYFDFKHWKFFYGLRFAAIMVDNCAPSAVA